MYFPSVVGAGVVSKEKEMTQEQQRIHTELSKRHQPLSSVSLLSLAESDAFSSEWKELAPRLRLSEAAVEQCRTKGHGEKGEVCYEVLKVWSDTEGPQATIANLTAAIFQIRAFHLLEVLYSASSE